MKFPLLYLMTAGFALLGSVSSANALDPINYSMQTLPDGSKISKDSDGSIILDKPNGTKVIKKSDGSFVEIEPDGKKIIHSADGTTVIIMADGTKIIKKPNGQIIEVKPPQPQGH